MSGDTDLIVRPAREDDWDSLIWLDSYAFGLWHSEAGRRAVRRKTRLEDIVVVEDAGRVVATAMFYRLEVTVPGGARLPMAGLTWVSVAPSHRRRGLLRRMLTWAHEQITAAGFPLCGLTASQATLYERFGYGPATAVVDVEVATSEVGFRDTAPDPGGVLLATTEEARVRLPELHRLWCAATPGAIQRTTADWERLFADEPADRGGRTPLFFLLHDGGYVTYRIDRSEGGPIIFFEDFLAFDDAARAALWRVLVGLELMPRVRGRLRSDSPLALLITDPRAVSVRGEGDQLWLRLHDVPAALAARTYPGAPAGAELVIHITERGFGAGDLTVRLRVAGGIGTCEVLVDGAGPGGPDVTVTLADLGSVYLGGLRARRLGHAGRLQARDERTVTLLDQVFSTDRQPQLGTFF